MDGQQQQRILGWLQEEDAEIVGGAEDDDERGQYPDEVSEYNTESEQECEEFEAEDDSDSTNDEFSSKNYYTVKQKVSNSTHKILYKWKKTPLPESDITKPYDIITEQQGAQGIACNVTNPLESWHLFMDLDTLQLIVEYTNTKILSMQLNYERERDCGITNLTEVKALIGLLYLIGLHKSSHTSINDIWINDGTGIEICRAVMSKQRFQFLLRVLRFDDIHTQEKRNKMDKLAPIRQLYESFVNNCEKHYTTTQYVTLDETIQNFKGSCQFRQVMTTKTSRRGIKLISLTDAQTFYTKKFEIYVGKQPEGPYQEDTSTDAVVRRMVEPIVGTGRNVTMDNLFTNIPLAEELLRDHNLTMVGTIKKNKLEIPKEFKNKDIEVFASVFGFNNTSTLVAYCPEKNKIKLLLSTLHHDAAIDPTSGNKLPEIIQFYNMTKGGVDVVDKLISTYSVARICSRWSLRFFFTFLDIAAVNAHVILDSLDSVIKMDRKSFLKTLAYDLFKPQLEVRATMENLPRVLKQSVRRFVPSVEEAPTAGDDIVATRRRCVHCPRKIDRKFKSMCHSCRGNICPLHSKIVCTECVKNV